MNYLAEHIMIRSEHRNQLMGLLNEELAEYVRCGWEIQSLQFLSENHKLATEFTFEWTQVYLVLVRRKR